MENVTHVLDIKVAVDMSTLFDQGITQGAKLVLGASEDSELIELYSEMIVNEITSSVLNKRKDQLMMVGATLSVNDMGNVSDNDEVSDSDYEEETSYDTLEDMEHHPDTPYLIGLEEDPLELTEDLPDEDAELLLDEEDTLDEYKQRVLEGIAQARFEAKSALGKEFVVYLEDYENLSELVSQTYGCKVDHMENIGVPVNDEQGFVLQYENISGNLKFIPSLD